ncbi:hypothetical protein NNJEOMEG_03568 [Fundidesulfovibrio magnetotacticus]|uniref:Uncharacterized protein n=1 Tax=Fundidesulfovibrio magnetotacticus TaxID=2730080 RepID=A0A6V8LXZ5_9BACT|nr:hypothetical protein [Fundidesulfovibrio magnetotacticus]GFK95700.1 hypothetical protein NNJEOMEG_03568 [Fundidesulfovibrio magnetotacticus]
MTQPHEPPSASGPRRYFTGMTFGAFARAFVLVQLASWITPLGVACFAALNEALGFATNFEDILLGGFILNVAVAFPALVIAQYRAVARGWDGFGLLVLAHVLNWAVFLGCWVPLVRWLLPERTDAVAWIGAAAFALWTVILARSPGYVPPGKRQVLKQKDRQPEP